SDRRQEDLRLQLPGHQGGDRPRPRQRAEREHDPRLLGGGTPSVRGGRGGITTLDGLHAVVTGGSSGIGRAIAETYAAEGAVVLITHRASPERASEVGAAHVLQADLATRAACERLVSEAHERLEGRIDVWVNNAGADVLTSEAADWEWERKLDLLLAVDLKGTITCSYAVAERMRERGGAIVNMSWDHVTTGMAGENPELFSAVKGGVLSFS